MKVSLKEWMTRLFARSMMGLLGPVRYGKFISCLLQEGETKSAGFLEGAGSRGDIRNILLKILKLNETDLLLTAYRQIGIGKNSFTASGEAYLISDFLKPYCSDGQAVFFDIGANVGEYAEALKAHYPHAAIYAFEPNPYSFEVLKEKLADRHCLNVAVGASQGRQIFYNDADNRKSRSASFHREFLTDMSKIRNVLETEVEVTTVDAFCEEKNIARIDLLKIDTEGYEYEVLKGAQKMLQQNRIRFIQFEFGGTDVISRIFLKDFYQILKGYRIYRLDTNRLIPLFDYNPRHEIFEYQNFVAVNSKISLMGT